MHLGHARTFWTAQERARAHDGHLVLRIEDLDRDRCRANFAAAIIEDLRWLGLHWDEGPDIGGVSAPYLQSQRDYFWAWEKLRANGFIYPCTCSRRDVSHALGAPHETDMEIKYPGTCRPLAGFVTRTNSPSGVNWRFRVPDGEPLQFVDARLGKLTAVAGCDFGDFVVWRKDNVPAYQLAVTADDSAMEITEVVRGEDLLTSTFRQLLLYRALDLASPRFYHCPLLKDSSGRRLAKRNDALCLKTLRERGCSREEVRAMMGPM